jgi:hypothetical protein
VEEVVAVVVAVAAVADGAPLGTIKEAPEALASEALLAAAIRYIR